MTAAKRNYKAEYARRIGRGATKGLTRAQSRGHPKQQESNASPRKKAPRYDPQLEQGLKLLRDGDTLNRSARSIGVAPERLRRYVAQTGVLEKRKGRWVVLKDNRRRRIQIYSDGRAFAVTLPGYEPAAEVGRYLAAVKEFLASNDPRHLQPFKGRFVTDIDRVRHVFETRPNVLYRITQSATETFEQVYRIVV